MQKEQTWQESMCSDLKTCPLALDIPPPKKVEANSCPLSTAVLNGLLPTNRIQLKGWCMSRSIKGITAVSWALLEHWLWMKPVVMSGGSHRLQTTNHNQKNFIRFCKLVIYQSSYCISLCLFCSSNSQQNPICFNVMRGAYNMCVYFGRNKEKLRDLYGGRN